MLTRIRNAQAVKKETVVVPFSKIKQDLAQTLKQAGLILDYEKKGRTITSRKLELKLKYLGPLPAITAVRRVAKPGQRIYIKHNEIFPKGRGAIRVISTSQGLMSDAEAKKNKLGGEVLCEIS